MADPIYCRACDGHGAIGPVHINHGGGRGEWVEQMPCRDCDGTGRWSAERLAAYERGQEHRLARVMAGETILQCAQRLGISPAEVSRMERGLEARNA